jgi:hypothetical protein
MTETIINILSREFDLVVGGVVIALIILPVFRTLKRIFVEKWYDLIGFGLAVILAVVYGFVRHSAFAGLEALAGSQLVFSLIKKGLLSPFLNNN